MKIRPACTHTPTTSAAGTRCAAIGCHWPPAALRLSGQCPNFAVSAALPWRCPGAALAVPSVPRRLAPSPGPPP